MFSIVITCYNRAALVVDAIDSAINFVEELGQGEIVIVDDHSTDESLEVITERYKEQIDAGRMIMIRNTFNAGVTGAKNRGARVASGEWIMFLDSDDKLQTGLAVAIEKVVRSAPASCPIIFFRCVGDDGKLIGPPQLVDIWLELPDFIRRGTPGECFPVMRSSFFCQIKYDEDLRGFEGLTYCRLIERFGTALLSPLAPRVYRTGSSDRLCAKKNIRRRGCRIALGYTRMLREFNAALGIKGIARLVGKVMLHSLRCLYSKAMA